MDTTLGKLLKNFEEIPQQQINENNTSLYTSHCFAFKAGMYIEHQMFC